MQERHMQVVVVTVYMPLGSVLWPLAWNAYINELCFVSSTKVYADDITILLACSYAVTYGKSGKNRLAKSRRQHMKGPPPNTSRRPILCVTGITRNNATASITPTRPTYNSALALDMIKDQERS
ncbi:hypothetical protein E2C01_019179 [Portunus trituberculatus]|uniref:Uncharacterized protein n=1 Tax=Portunus trituberculatus TaxID=210409 RepID=A0A5B7DX68_PORTR|nr:hypothetical protein [Portunus trituberculatus]